MIFKGKVAIVTGAGQGIGFEICRMLAEKGTIVVLNDVDQKLADNAAAIINQQYDGKCLSMPGDSSDVDFINNMVANTVKLYHSLDIVIANAGITLFGDFLTFTKESFDKVMGLNLGGSFFLAQAAALQMKQQNEGGAILFTSSVVGHQAVKDLAAYAMTKAALEMLAKNLVIELSPYKITVNTVAPGATLTERTTKEADYEKEWSAITPMGRPAYVTDIAHTALFLVSDQARHITGQTIIVDGGWTSVSILPTGVK
ncbi:SDR family NAD(P)-dependent oxidoreductase [Mucilaginibacter glaciei]|uniref:SDR family oxidoreductase n=1 Tax=Mucilaginibacter glaciei TaxID=2772109 RepID=A0A926NYN5_9SPHI|nr:SDR family oxidoreductase [Mucilaginibacter glaciei]MBD1394084.1 SDR family oxidoreductase [Mucilaginibacter glaciei]